MLALLAALHPVLGHLTQVRAVSGGDTSAAFRATSALAGEVFVKYSGWQIPDASEATWVVIMASVGAVLAIVVARATRDGIYPLVFAWAYVAIAVRQVDDDLIFPTTLGLAGGMVVLGGVTLVRKRKQTSAVA